MKICGIQIMAEKGNVRHNLEHHCEWIEATVSRNPDLIIFPELSLTGYEPTLAKDLATTQDDPRLEIFQKLSEKHTVTIGIGMPTKSEAGIHISLVFFQPGGKRLTYSKQLLHADEKPFFVEGKDQLILTIRNKKIAPAICFEALQEEHAKNAKRLGADVYLASVAKSEKGMEKAMSHFPAVAKRYSMPVLMVNSIGPCDNFLAAGQSASWNDRGELLEKLDKDEEGIVIFPCH